jgi:hypothetical protein
MKNSSSPNWKSESDEHDYRAAANYLSLLINLDEAKTVAERFKGSPISNYLAKDLLRSSRLPLLPKDNYHVQTDLKKVKEGKLLSPVLLLRGDLEKGRPMIIADGYHRVCASYYLDENAEVYCHIVDF